MRLSAPGKLILFGEYAVLEGAPAVVMAVNRRAHIAFRKKGYEPANSLVSRTYARLRAHYGLSPEPCLLSVDSRSFYRGTRKLGLGSSAAATLLTVAATAIEAGRDLRSEADKRELWELAQAAQNAFFGRFGSGLDLAASLFGGTTLFEASPQTTRFAPFVWPSELRRSFFWLGQPASTADFLKGLARFRGEQTLRYEKRLAELCDIARHMAYDSLTCEQWLAAIGAYGSALFALGEDAGLPIVTPCMNELAQYAQALGGAAKPSGAGGGDFLLAVFAEAKQEEAFAKKAAALGLLRMNFACDPCGLSNDEESPVS